MRLFVTAVCFITVATGLTSAARIRSGTKPTASTVTGPDTAQRPPEAGPAGPSPASAEQKTAGDSTTKPGPDSAAARDSADSISDLMTRGNFPVIASRAFKDKCGVRRSSLPPEVAGRIVGGRSAEPGEFPWQVSLQLIRGWFAYHVCGATLLGRMWAVTAAHCVHQVTREQLSVVVGDQDIHRYEGVEQRRKVIEIIKHQKYNSATYANDIALLKLDSPVMIDGLRVRPICLPERGQESSGPAIVSGWGKLVEGGATSSILQQVTLPLMSDSRCRQLYDMKIPGASHYVLDSMICAGSELGGKDACQGDSGGPLVCPNPDGSYSLCGIVSWGIGCGRPGLPGIYTETSHFIEWINSNMQ